MSICHIYKKVKKIVERFCIDFSITPKMWGCDRTLCTLISYGYRRL